jgi:hypothetical protein
LVKPLVLWSDHSSAAVLALWCRAAGRQATAIFFMMMPAWDMPEQPVCLPGVNERLLPAVLALIITVQLVDGRLLCGCDCQHW